jgi:hypothetical protein
MNRTADVRSEDRVDVTVQHRHHLASEADLRRDYVVPPLEGLWWAEDMNSFTGARDKLRWDWTLMLMVPEWIDQDMVLTGMEQASAKNRPARLDDVRLETLSEGRCVQTLHVGSFDDEAEVLAHLHDDLLPRNQLSMVGKHHEIYLSDFRKVAPEKQRTILRQPVVAVPADLAPQRSRGVVRTGGSAPCGS